MKRIYAFDNLKCFLILCVLVGHLLEVCTDLTVRHPLYKIIYSFHMPAFLFLSGFFAKFRINKVLQFIGIYLLFQLLYQAFVHGVLYGAPIGTFQYSVSTPYWLLWYMVVIIYYYCLIPLMNLFKGVYQMIVVALSLILALAAGHWNTIGYPYSLSRFFCFLPFFTAGYFLGLRREAVCAKLQAICQSMGVWCVPAGLAAIAVCIYRCLTGPFIAQMMYGSYSYAIGYNLWVRLELFAIATVWIAVLLVVFLVWLNRKLLLVSFVGRHTLPIYLLHGFLIKLIAFAV